MRLSTPLTLAAAPILAAASLVAAGPPPIPTDLPVLLVGHKAIRGAEISECRAVFSMGRTGKEGPLGYGEKIEARALQNTRIERVQIGDTVVLRRTTEIRRAGSDDVLARASIDMHPETLLPLNARTEQGGKVTTLDYDWQQGVIRRSPSGEQDRDHDEIPLDIPMFEVGAHDVWMAALPLRSGYSARLPTVFGATGTKYWAVPRVVGDEPVDLGDGKRRAAWVVELDWWGMGASNTADNHSVGGGVRDTAGAGGKYWVLKQPVEGLPRVVRVRTEVSPEADSVIQLQ